MNTENRVIIAVLTIIIIVFISGISIGIADYMEKECKEHGVVHNSHGYQCSDSQSWYKL